MNPILNLLRKYKGARYSGLLLSGVLVGLWLGNQYPAANAAFWAMPIVSLVVALAAIVGGKQATDDWKEKVEIALNTAPPGKTICGCEQEQIRQ